MQGLKNQHLNSNTMFMVSALWFNTSWNFHSLLWWEINSRWCKKFRHTGYNGASRNCKQERLNERGKDFCSKEQEDWVKTGTSCSEDVYLSYLGILVILVIKVALDLRPPMQCLCPYQVVLLKRRFEHNSIDADPLQPTALHG